MSKIGIEKKELPRARSWSSWRSLGFRKIDRRMLGRQMYVSLEICLPRMVNRPAGVESNARLATCSGQQLALRRSLVNASKVSGSRS
jgi:hypothetical protein